MTQQRVLGGPDVVKRLKQVDAVVFTTQDCTIEVPSRFMERDLGDIGERILVYGLFAIIFNDGKYKVLNVCAKVELFPYQFEKVMVDDTEYYRFGFKKDTPVFSRTVVRNDLLMYEAFDEFFFKGKLPWYVNHEMKSKVFDTASSHANSNVASNAQAMEFAISLTSRDNRDRTKLIRQTATSLADFDKYGTTVPMASVYYGIKSPLNKITGSYFREGIVSSLVNPVDKADRVEQVLRA